MWRDTTPSPRHCSVHLQAVRLTHTYVHTQTHTQTPFPQFRLRRITTASTCSGVKALLHIAHHCKNPKSQQLASLVRPGLQPAGGCEGVSPPRRLLSARPQTRQDTAALPQHTHTLAHSSLHPTTHPAAPGWTHAGLPTCPHQHPGGTSPHGGRGGKRPRWQCSAVQCSAVTLTEKTSLHRVRRGRGQGGGPPSRQGSGGKTASKEFREFPSDFWFRMSSTGSVLRRRPVPVDADPEVSAEIPTVAICRPCAAVGAGVMPAWHRAAGRLGLCLGGGVSTVNCCASTDGCGGATAAPSAPQPVPAPFHLWQRRCAHAVAAAWRLRGRA